MSNCRINIFEPGNVLSNKWVILELIGKGAMGEIYLARQLNLQRDVAIKVVSEALLKDFFDFRKADQRADIYSLGKILFEAISGKIGQGTTPFKTVSLPNTETPFFEKLDRVIQNATAENRGNRLASVAQLRTATLDAIDAFKKKPSATNLAGSKRSPFLHNPKRIWTGVAIAIIAVAAMTTWHLMGEPGNSSKVLESPPMVGSEVEKAYRNESSPIEILPSDTPKQSILAEDGASMHFVPAGMVTLPKSSGSQPERSVRVNPFYMDETLVTNHQYVEFLNHNLSMIRVERGVVHAEDEIWLLLGEVMEGYEPIVFQKGELKVSKIAYASLPALRVTAYGASSYARFYNRRLPTYTEWLRALGNGDTHTDEPSHDGGDSPEETNIQSMHDMMRSQAKSDVSRPKSPDLKLSSVINDPPNKYGLRGLNKKIKEWGLKVSETTSRDNIREAEFVVLPSTIQRYPWEGFGEVGFRCVREARIKSK